MPGLLLAQVTSDNTPEGAYFTLWFPLGLFIIVAAILWVLYTRPHRRVPPRQTAPAHAGQAASAAATGTGLAQGAAAQASSPAAGGTGKESGEPGQSDARDPEDGE